MFTLKKVIDLLVLRPLPISLLLLITGVCLLWFTRRHRLGKGLVTAGLGVLLLCSFMPLPYLGAHYLEKDYPGYAPEGVIEDSVVQQSVRWVVVLGGGTSQNGGLPANDRLYSESLIRLSEGVRQLHLHPHAQLLLTGGSLRAAVSSAAVMREAALSMGVPPGRIVLEEASLDTRDHARYLREIVGRDTLVLVTSAFHMPRAVALFEHEGLQVIPAATAHLNKDPMRFHWTHLVPGSGHLERADLVLHEWIGRAWARLRGQTR